MFSNQDMHRKTNRIFRSNNNSLSELKDLSVTELNETLMELEVVIRRYSETLISQLAHRDELEYEKELKNTFISLLLQVDALSQSAN